MNEASAIFVCREVEWELCIEPAVLRRFAEHRQLGPRAPEAGGQLFAAFEKYRVRITHLTGPRPADRRSRFSFFPDRRLENREIKQRFGTGLHFVGDWHTHPEARPSPSGVDLASMTDCFRKSRHSLTHFVMIIVGQEEGASGLWVSLHDAKRCIRMKLVTPVVSAKEPGENLVPPRRIPTKKSPLSRWKKALGFGRRHEST